jgi:serine/threonine protein phosphatase 1
VRIYAIGDIHGRLDLLNAVLIRIDNDLSQFPVHYPMQVFLGDYIDRGPASRQVIDRLVLLKKTHHPVFLKGNHDGYILEFLKNPAVLSEWRQLGGLETLLSYGLRPPINADGLEQTELAQALDKALSTEQKHFLAHLRPSFSYGDFFFAHAGVRPGIPLHEQQEDDLLWIRDEFLFYEEKFEKFIVHGHTPVPKPDQRHNRINIDTGAYATGRLTCLVIDRDRLAPI